MANRSKLHPSAQSFSDRLDAIHTELREEIRRVIAGNVINFPAKTIHYKTDELECRDFYLDSVNEDSIVVSCRPYGLNEEISIGSLDFDEMVLVLHALHIQPSAQQPLETQLS